APEARAAWLVYPVAASSPNAPSAAAANFIFMAVMPVYSPPETGYPGHNLSGTNAPPDSLREDARERVGRVNRARTHDGPIQKAWSSPKDLRAGELGPAGQPLRSRPWPLIWSLRSPTTLSAGCCA